jgi:hypothetical protein
MIKWAGLNPDLAGKIGLPVFEKGISEKDVQATIDLTQKYKLIRGPSKHGCHQRPGAEGLMEEFLQFLLICGGSIYEHVVGIRSQSFKTYLPKSGWRKTMAIWQYSCQVEAESLFPSTMPPPVHTQDHLACYSSCPLGPESSKRYRQMGEDGGEDISAGLKGRVCILSASPRQDDAADVHCRMVAPTSGRSSSKERVRSATQFGPAVSRVYSAFVWRSVMQCPLRFVCQGK